jgi:hypothetical protein
MKDLKHTIMNLEGKIPDTTGDMGSFKENFRKGKKKTYQKTFREGHKRMEVILTLKDWGKFKTQARKHGLKPGPFLKAAADAYLQKYYLLPDEKKLHDLEINLRRIGNNINQTARWTNKKQQVELAQLNHMQVQLNDLENWVRHAFTSPHPLLEVTIREMRRSHHFRDQVAQALIKTGEEHAYQNSTMEEEESGNTTEVHRKR